jgi:hypothetical protein
MNFILFYLYFSFVLIFIFSRHLHVIAFLVNNSLQLYSIDLVDVLFGLMVLFESRWINIEREREREKVCASTFSSDFNTNRRIVMVVNLSW